MQDIYRELGLLRSNPAGARLQPMRSKVAGYALEALSVLATAGILLVLAAAVIYYLSYFAAGGSLNDDPTGVILAVIAAGVFAVNLGWRLKTLGQRLLVKDALEKLKDDSRPPVVYLRPFIEDSRLDDDNPEGQRIGGLRVGHGQFWQRRASLEETIARDVEAIGPFIAIGHPGDKLCPLGASRLYLSNDEWQVKVELLVRNAAGVVMLPETTVGTRWEFRFVANAVDSRRILLLVPNPAVRPLGYARVRALIGDVLRWPIPAEWSNVDAFMLDLNGAAAPLTLKRDTEGESGLKPWVERIAALGEPSPWTADAVERAAGVEQELPSPTPAAVDGEFDTVNIVLPPQEPSPWGSAENISSGFVKRLVRQANRAYLAWDVLNIAGALALTLFTGAMTLRNISDDKFSHVTITGVLCAIGIAWLIFFLRKAYALHSLQTHPVGIAFAAFGDMNAVARDLEADFAGQPIDTGPLYVGRRWVCHVRRRRVMIQPAGLFVWAYWEEVDRGKDGVAYQLVMWTRKAVAHVLPMSKQETEICLDKLAKMLPWLYFEYNDVLKESWNSDRDDFIASVDKRRAAAGVV